MINGQEFQRIATFTVTKYNEETQTVTGVNDFGAEIVIQESQLRALYYEKQSE